MTTRTTGELMHSTFEKWWSAQMSSDNAATVRRLEEFNANTLTLKLLGITPKWEDNQLIGWNLP